MESVGCEGSTLLVCRYGGSTASYVTDAEADDRPTLTHPWREATLRAISSAPCPVIVGAVRTRVVCVCVCVSAGTQWRSTTPTCWTRLPKDRAGKEVFAARSWRCLAFTDVIMS